MVPNKRALRIAAARAVVAAYTAPGGATSLDALARETGYSPSFIKEILASSEWDALVATEILRQVAPLVTTGLAFLKTVLENESGKTTESARMRAHEIVLKTYSCLQQHRPGHQLASSEDAIDAILEALPQADAIVSAARPEVSTK